MITEDYCSYEVVKLLKEKGFNEYCLKNYWSSDKELHDWKWELSYNRNNDGNRNTKDCAAPTLQMAMKWLREVHDIKIMIRPYVDGTYSYEILNGFWYVNFDSYEDATEEAIKYCLEYLI